MKKIWINIFGLVSCSLFSQGIPYGHEFQVNSYIEGDQRDPCVAAFAGGGFVVCWVSADQYDFNFNIHAQLFDALGEKKSNEFQINTFTEYSQRNPSVAALATGGFVVCWESWIQDGSGFGIFGQVFDESGEKTNSEFQVNTYTDAEQTNPSVTSLINGGFVICWDSWFQDGSDYGVFGQMYDESGAKRYDEFQVNTYTINDQFNPNIAALAGGGFVVCWIRGRITGFSNSVYGQVFDKFGNKKKDEFRINTYTGNELFISNIAAFAEGGFVVCWANKAQGVSGYDIYGQEYDKFGEKKNDEFKVNTTTNNDQMYPGVATLAGGGFVVCWYGVGHDDWGYGVYEQVFDQSGEMKYGENLVNSYSENNQMFPCITSLPEGGFVVCWVSDTQDGSGWGLFAKILPSSPLLHMLKPFVLIGPLNDATLNAHDTRLLWSQPSNQQVFYPWELHYKIFVADNPDFSSPQIFEQDQDTTLTLRNLTPGTTYFWKVLAKNIVGDSLWSSNTNAFFVSHDATGIQEAQTSPPNQFVLHQNYPNPFNPETTIRFDLPENGDIDISIFDISGKLVKVLLRESRPVGSHSDKWDGKNSAGNAMPSGIYICRMEAKYAGGKMFVKTVKMGIVR